MASIACNAFLARMLTAWLSGADVRVALVMTSTTCDTENDGIVNVADYTTLDEFDGANYVRKTVTGESIEKDETNDRGEYHLTIPTWTALGAGTRQIAGILLIENVDGTDANDLAGPYFEYSTPKTGDGSDFIATVDSEGLFRLAKV